MASNSTDSDDDLFGEGQLVVDESAESDKENEEREIQTPTDTSQKRKRKRLGIAFPEDGLCQYCENKKSVTRSNWARHLSLCHSDVVKGVEDQQASQEKQAKLNFPVDNKGKKPNRLLALYVATSTTPLRHVDNRYLKALLSKVPGMKVPDRRQLASQIDSELVLLQSTIAKYLGDSRYYYSFGVDISTTKGMLTSFLGTTAHVFAKNNATIHVFGLDMVPLSEKHTAAYIFKTFSETLAKYKLIHGRTLRVVTDCGRNVMNAFYEPYRVVDEEAEPEDEELMFIERDEDEMRELEDGDLADDGFDEITQDFDFMHNWHVKCVIHRLETCLRHAVGKESSVIALRKKIFKSIGPFARSHVLTTQLYNYHRTTSGEGRGLKLLFPANTRWSSIDLTLRRVVRMRPALAKVCYDNKVQEISAEDYAKVDEVLKITGPIRNFEKKLQQESVPTISLVYPGIKGLIGVLGGLQKKKVLPEICADLQTRIRESFNDVLESGKEGSDPIFMAASCLDPAVAQAARVFDDHYEQAVAALQEMTRLLVDENDAPVVAVEEAATSSTADVFGFELEVPRKKKAPFVGTSKDKLWTEIDEYRALIQSRVDCTAAEFWSKYDGKLSYLSAVARNVLAVPAASSSVERLFSQMTLHSKGQKNRSGAQAIRRKALFSFNEKYINV